MNCEVISELSQHVLSLPCNASVSATSECHEGDGIMTSHDYWILCVIVVVWLLNKSVKMMKFVQKCRFCVRLCYDECYAYEILHHIFKITNIKVNLTKINSIVETNDVCNENQDKCW